jgi:hypothetical protein
MFNRKCVEVPTGPRFRLQKGSASRRFIFVIRRARNGKAAGRLVEIEQAAQKTTG